MRQLLGICLLAAAHSSTLSGQPLTVPVKWIGTWRLDVSKSTFGTILIPGVPSDLTVVSQRVRVEQVGQAIRLSGETVMSDSGGRHTSEDDSSLSLDGTEAVAGPLSLSFRYVDASTFEIVSKLDFGGRNFGEVSRFWFSADGSRLTETKTQTEREGVPVGADKASGAVLRTSTFILMFHVDRGG